MYWLLHATLYFVRSIYVVACSCTFVIFIALDLFYSVNIALAIIFTRDGHWGYLELLCMALR